MLQTQGQPYQKHNYDTELHGNSSYPGFPAFTITINGFSFTPVTIVTVHATFQFLNLCLTTYMITLFLVTHHDNNTYLFSLIQCNFREVLVDRDNDLQILPIHQPL